MDQKKREKRVSEMLCFQEGNPRRIQEIFQKEKMIATPNVTVFYLSVLKENGVLLRKIDF